MRVNNARVAATAPALPTTVIAPIAMNAAFTSYAIQIWEGLGFAVQLVITGTPTGTFKLQASCDPCPQGSLSAPLTAFTPTNWTDILNSSQAVSAAGSITWNADGQYYNFLRIVYTDGSGGTSTATFTGRVNIKGY